MLTTSSYLRSSFNDKNKPQATALSEMIYRKEREANIAVLGVSDEAVALSKVVTDAEKHAPHRWQRCNEGGRRDRPLLCAQEFSPIRTVS